jgi:cyclase
MSYTLGLHELSNGCHAYLQPDGGWGWSNAGLIVGDGESLLVDTLFDLKITQRMLDSMVGVTKRAPISTVVNTHANGDHCYGNQLLAGSEIIASEATAHEMSEVGGRKVELVEVGPAHTQGDTLVFVPDARTVYTGDILFIGGTPVVWVGPLDNWIAACDLICAADVDHIVPGHGPLTDKAGVIAIRDYLTFVQNEATGRFEAGMDAWDAARDIALNGFGEWGEFGRLAVNVDTVYRTLSKAHKSPDVVEQFRRMWALEQKGH